ncbi:hypothetical protein WN51_07384 [Melipona quadrifasciata]|uniref:Uncharacterized protein n=1 Tax=Melipona quadrifasciata TaxID=166423 RepID=A0A0N0BBX5_9HYME|nr:hypothetical protein WN51_07384 [Melipona quadrifasciata]
MAASNWKVGDQRESPRAQNRKVHFKACTPLHLKASAKSLTFKLDSVTKFRCTTVSWLPD